ncbi:Hypothetical protein PHPALM_18551 [Phytophthora palmivora]|uniref:Uncharacterized protein n=1 Tax=Phytophthora palmivora TaxID=4796 RepID=A0A2P4XJH1_9STRA|nr:Hypothetical protein PHPALM_18551 [Phytophthora palmivora]
MKRIQTRGRDHSAQRPQSPVVGWVTVLLLLVLSASCGWYSQQVSFSYEGEHDVNSVKHEVIVRRQQLLAKVTAQAGDSGSSTTSAKLMLELINIPSDASQGSDNSNVIINPMRNIPEDAPSTPKPTPSTPKPSTPAPSKSPTPKSQPDPNIEKLWAPVKTLAELNEFECVAWRQTANCSPRGDLKPARDGSCDRIILQVSGESNEILVCECHDASSI